MVDTMSALAGVESKDADSHKADVAGELFGVDTTESEFTIDGGQRCCGLE